MPIISRIGRKSRGSRATLGAFYLLLTAGAITMVYPLLLMLATSVTGPPDLEQFDLLPEYLHRDDALVARYIEEKYLSPDWVADHYGVASALVPSFKLTTMRQLLAELGDEIGWDSDELPSTRLRQLQEYEAFLQEVVPDELLQIGFEVEFGIPRLSTRLYWEFLERRFDGDVAAMNRSYGEDRATLMMQRMPLERVAYRSWIPPRSPRYQDFLEFKNLTRVERPELLQSFNGDTAWRRHLQDVYDGQIQRLNRDWQTSYQGFDELRLPLYYPPDSGAGVRLIATGSPAPFARGSQASPIGRAWDDFVRRKWSPRHMQWDAAKVTPLWRQYLEQVYLGRAGAAATNSTAEQLREHAVALLNAAHDMNYGGFNQVPLPRPAEMAGQISADFFAFVRGGDSRSTVTPDTRHVRLITLASCYVDHLRQRHADLAAVNSAYGRTYQSWDDVRPPVAAYDWWSVVRDRAGWRWYLATNGFHLVWDGLAIRGGVLANTAAFVILSIALQLLVNPLCAYALSRFDLSYGGKVLLFLLATMAFPAEVTMIPGFLLLRDLDLLNTFGALLLPGAASGFMIFILKGFFDTLPRELYEAAQLDGAGEFRMFWQIAVPLCRPVLAYLALIAFMAAYTTFLFALVICQDSRMWTLMVWIYQLQGTVHDSVQIAALLVVMMPTLVVFILCQRVIMRGVVLPQLH